MKKKLKKIRLQYILMSILFSILFIGCITSTSQFVNKKADQSMYKPVNYSSNPGPSIIVLPGQIKSANAKFRQKITSNNIADFAELELHKANFNVLERQYLGAMLDEITRAVHMGNSNALQKFKRGKYKSTKWFAQFDILKAEPVARANKGFHGGTLGRITHILTPGKTGAVAEEAGRSAGKQEEARIWLIGLRYKIINASTTEQVATNYLEAKMELGSQGAGFLGFSEGQEKIVTLDTMTHRLVQEAVSEIDQRYKADKGYSPSRTTCSSNKGDILKINCSRANIRNGPGMNYSVIKSLSHGTRLEMIGQSGSWIHIKMPSGSKGWIYGNLVN